MKQQNPRFGSPRIAQQISKTLGIEINKDTVRRVLGKHYRPGSNDGVPSCQTLISHLTDSFRNMSRSQFELRLLNNHRILGALSPFTRQIIGCDIYLGHVDQIVCSPLFESATLMMKTQKPFDPHHDPPLHRRCQELGGVAFCFVRASRL